MEYTMESFISFCDDMMIAEEAGMISTIRGGIKNAFNRFISMIKELVRRIKEAIKMIFTGKTSKEEELEKKNIALMEKAMKVCKKLYSKKCESKKDLSQMVDQLEKLNSVIKEKDEENEKLKNEIKDLKGNIEDLKVEIKITEVEKDVKAGIHKFDQDKANDEIYELKRRLDEIAKREEEVIMNHYKWAKEDLEKGRNKDTVIDQWGYVEFCLKAYPEAEKLISDNIRIINDAQNNKFNEDEINSLAEKIQDQYSTCKSIFRHSEQDSAYNNPKEYSHSILDDYLNGLLKITGKLQSAESGLRKIMESHITNNKWAAGAVTVDKSVDNSELINKIFAMSINLIAVLQSYESLVYKVKSMNSNYRPQNYMSYKNYRGYYNYGNKKDRYDRNDEVEYTNSKGQTRFRHVSRYSKNDYD